jgi:hypothetical protein
MQIRDEQTTFKAWVVYQGIYAHFMGAYDYFKYSGNGNFNNIEMMRKQFAKQENGGISMQRTIFTNLSKTYENKDALIFFYLSQFSNDIMWPTYFDYDLYDEYVKRMNNFDFNIKQDIEQIKKYMEKYEVNFDDIFKVDGINHPVIMKMSLSKTISIETVAVLDMIIEFIKDIDNSLDDPLWRDHSKLIKNYKPFLEVDVVKSKKIIMDVLTKE